MFAKVLVYYGVKSLDKTFTYKIPEYLTNKIKEGMKVVVPFGTKEINGFVLSITADNKDDYELKSIIRIYNDEIILNKELLELGLYLKKRTLCSLITAYETMLPRNLKIRSSKKSADKFDTYITLTDDENLINEFIINNPRKTKQLEIIESLQIDHEILKNVYSASLIKSLIDNNVVKIVKKQHYRIDYGTVYDKTKYELTSDQNIAFKAVELNKYDTYLLHGVTGSGKTEVYLSLINEVLKNGKTAICLVPEISLTTQMIERFYNMFGSKVAVLHSALSDGEKYDEYLKIIRGEVSIVIGARSAVFAPLNNLGIIIIDEEHSENFKQENNPRYSALEMATYRAKYNNAPLILGSATPSLETMARAKKGLFKYLSLPNRVGNSILPKVYLVNMEEEMKQKRMIISSLLENKIKDRLIKNEQIMLLLNRRGFSTTITCSNCGYTYKCPHCDITLTYHKSSNNLRCHYCGYTVLKNDLCPECHEESLNYYGLGTEKLENEISKLFNARVLRMDADTTRNKGMHEKIINDFKEHKYDILLGTQMISKGLDFPLVTLVGVINADATLNIPDFRANEKTFSLLSQVSGRAGRREMLGEVVIQTFNPDNYTLQCVKNNDYDSFYVREMDIRHKLSYPPYFYLTGIKVASKSYEKASSEAFKVKNYLAKNLSNDSIVLGPTIASMFRINNIYHFQIIIKYKKDDKLFNVLMELEKEYIMNKDILIEIDNNPSNI